MSDLDVSSIATILAAIGVLIGLILTILELRELVAQRKMEAIMRLIPYLNIDSSKVVEASETVFANAFTDFDDFVQKYGDPHTSKTPVVSAYNIISGRMETIGSLYYNRLIDRKLWADLNGAFYIKAWEVLKPLIAGERERTKMPKLYEYAEYMAEDMKQRMEKGA
jgi:hypothetical protein